MSCATFSPTRSRYISPTCPPMCLSEGSAGVRWRFLKGAVGGSVEDRSVGCQHVLPCFLSDSLRLWLVWSLRGLLVLVLFRTTVGPRASLGDHLVSSMWLIAAGMLWERRRDGVVGCNCMQKYGQRYLIFLFFLGVVLFYSYFSLIHFSCTQSWVTTVPKNVYIISIFIKTNRVYPSVSMS